jgi:Arc/MetJ-type ribon-helix-helix transcriptional regulator
VEYAVDGSPRYADNSDCLLDEHLLKAADQAARRTRKNRSEFMHEALREHLRKLEIKAMEERDREGYARHPQHVDEVADWEAEAAWPE